MVIQLNKNNQNFLVLFIYASVELFLEPLIRSLNNQSCKDFSVIIFNDGIQNVTSLFVNLDVSYQIINVSGSLKEIRMKAFKLLKESDAKTIIFQDSDDLMSNNRVEVCLNYLKSYALVCNDLDLIDTNGNLIKKNYWTCRLSNSYIFNYNFIRKFNIVGLGNTSIKKELLDYDIQFSNDNILAIDWFVFYQLLEKSRENAIFVNTCETIYRQHQSNQVGLGEFTLERLKRAVNVKTLHFVALKNIGYNDFNKELIELEKIKTEQLKSFKSDNNKSLFWWEETEINYEKN